MAHSDMAGRGNPPSLLFSAKPTSICTDGSRSAVSDRHVEVRSPEVIRGEHTNGSLVPAYGSTGKFCFLLLLLFLLLISSYHSFFILIVSYVFLGDEDSDSSRNQPRVSSPILRDDSMTHEDIDQWVDAEDSSPGRFVSWSQSYGVFVLVSTFIVVCFRGLWLSIPQFLWFHEPSG